MCFISDEELSGNSAKIVDATPASDNFNQDATDDLTKELQKLSSLKNNGVISDSEYEELRKNAIDKHLNK
jgi:hypothetical protein